MNLSHKKLVLAVCMLYLIFLVSFSANAQMAATDCEHRCTASIVKPHSVAIAGIDATTRAPVFKDTTVYKCERVTYCEETCKSPEELCKEPLNIESSQFTYTSRIEGYWKIYTVSGSTTFECSDKSSYGPYPFTAETKDKYCDEYTKALNAAVAEREKKCRGVGEVSEQPQITGSGTDCAKERKDVDNAKAELDREQNKLDSLKQELEAKKQEIETFEGELSAKESELAVLEGEYARIMADIEKMKKIYDERKAVFDYISWRLTVAWIEALGSVSGPCIGTATHIIGFVGNWVWRGDAQEEKLAAVGAEMITEAIEIAGEREAMKAAEIARELGAMRVAKEGIQDLLTKEIKFLKEGPRMGTAVGLAIAVAISGLELEELKEALKEAEKLMIQARGWYDSAKMQLRIFQRDGKDKRMAKLKREVSELQKKIDSLKSALTDIERDIAASDKILTPLNQRFYYLGQIYDDCLARSQAEAAKAAQTTKEKECNDAKAKEKKAKEESDACIAAK